MTSKDRHTSSIFMWVITIFSMVVSIRGFTFPPKHHLIHTAAFSLSSTKKDTTEELSSTSGKGFAKNIPKIRTKSPLEEDDSIMTTTTTTTTSSSSPQDLKVSAGQEALNRLRQTDMQRRSDELKSMQQLQQLDQSLKEDPSLAVIPEKVAARMGKRMLPFVGLPLFGSMLTFVVFWYLATYKDFSIPTVVVAYATSAILIIGLLGITYSVMSASWDEDREGSAMGWEEFQTNVNNVKDGLKRSRENAILRDKLSNLSEEEKKKLGSDKLK